MPKYEGWEPAEGGVIIDFGMELFVATHDLIELRDDLTEAIHDARGYVALDIMVRDVLPRDLIYVLGNCYTVTNLLSAEQFPDEHEYIIQFENGSFTSVLTEVFLPGDQQVTVYRRPDDAAASM